MSDQLIHFLQALKGKRGVLKTSEDPVKKSIRKIEFDEQESSEGASPAPRNKANGDKEYDLVGFIA
jgi:hypothetical protein